MKRSIMLFASGLLLTSGSALAKDYGDAGTIELGGDFVFTSSSAKLEDDDTGFKTDNTGTDLEIAPSAYYYLIDGLPLIVSLELGMSSDTDNESSPKETDTTQGFGLGLGTGYFVKVGKARIGPAISLGFSTETQKSDSDDSEITRSGPEVTIAGLAKLPIGTGGVITAGLFIENEMQTEKVKDVDGEADVNTLSIGTSIGFSVFF